MGTLGRWWRRRGAYLWWRIAHPSGRFREWYVEAVERRLAGGEVHATLGGESAAGEHFQRTGRAMFERLCREGLRPDMRVVDYGCGSLRVGRHVIAHQAPGAYTGLDLVARFFEEGRATLDPELVAGKRPAFGVIGEDELARRAREPADLVYSTGVVIHVPRSELDEYLARLARLVAPGGRVLISFYDDRRHRPAGDLTWTWPAAELLAAAARHGLKGDAVALEELALPAGRGCVNSLLRLDAAAERRAPYSPSSPETPSSRSRSSPSRRS